VSVAGADAAGFLESLLTAEIGKLAPGRCVPSAAADRKGHCLADLWVLRLCEGYLLRIHEDRVSPLLDHFAHHRVGEEVAWTVLPDTAPLLLAGPAAADAVREYGLSYMEGECEGGPFDPRAFDPPAPAAIGRGGWMRVREISPADFLIATYGRGPWLETARELRRPPPRASREAFHLRRIEVGTPWFGLDAGDERLVPEAVPSDRISYEKGCYLGQEIIARLHYQGHRNWVLVRIRLRTETVPANATPLLVREGSSVDPAAKAGWVTSAARHPDGEVAALAFVNRHALAPGVVLVLPQGERVTVLGPADGLAGC
jgi:tRNA-modifying protein YgfZ